MEYKYQLTALSFLVFNGTVIGMRCGQWINLVLLFDFS